MALDPLRVAMWRFEQISLFLQPHLTAAERRRLMEAAAQIPVIWPSGREAPVPVSTLYRWLRLYRDDPRIEALMPEPCSRSPGDQVICRAWIEHALADLEQEPERSLFILARRLQLHFNLPHPPARATLHRALGKEPRYHAAKKRARGEKRVRRRFAASSPHEIWQGDAKAKFSVCFANGEVREVRVLSLLDDATRNCLKALIVRTESTAAAIGTFRAAAGRWGLPLSFYADRGSAYDSHVFRQGLATLGVHRINTRPRNAAAHGKVEAYHRVLDKWFIKELRHQKVLDFEHLQALLDAFIEELYNDHVHRELKQTPREALGNTVSSRQVSLERLQDAFLAERTLTYHRKDRTIRLAGTLFRIPNDVLTPGRKVRIAHDLEDPTKVYLIRRPGVFEPLSPAVKPAGKKEPPPRTQREEPAGSLSPLLEKYRGRTLPQARPGFGLPEIYLTFSQLLGRPVPATQKEAAIVVQWLQKRGPFDPHDFRQALDRTLKRLGNGRPLSQLIQDMDRNISPDTGKDTP